MSLVTRDAAAPPEALAVVVAEQGTTIARLMARNVELAGVVATQGASIAALQTRGGAAGYVGPLPGDPDLYNSRRAYLRLPLGFVGMHHWETDPGLAVVFALTGGLMLFGWGCDLILTAVAHEPPHRSYMVWRVVRAYYSCYAAYLLSNALRIVTPHVFTHVPPELMAVVGACLPLRLLREAGNVAVGVLFLAGAAVVMRDDPRDPRAFHPFWLLWFFCRIKNTVAAPLLRLFVSRSLIDLDDRWKEPDGTEVQFHRQWSEAYHAFAVVCFACQLGLLAYMYVTFPGFKFLGTAFNINEAFAIQVMQSA